MFKNFFAFVSTLLILLLCCSCSSSDAYTYKFVSYQPSLYRDGGICSDCYYGPELASGVGWPKNKNAISNNEFIIKTFLGKDERIKDIEYVDIILYDDNGELSRITINKETYDNSVIRQKDWYRNYLRDNSIIAKIVYFGLSLDNMSFNLFANYTKNDFKIEQQFDLSNNISKDYEGKIFIEYYGVCDSSNTIIRPVTQFSWDLKYTPSAKTYTLSNYKHKSLIHDGWHDMTYK